jgi:hypothetical protein
LKGIPEFLFNQSGRQLNNIGQKLFVVVQNKLVFLFSTAFSCTLVKWPAFETKNTARKSKLQPVKRKWPFFQTWLDDVANDMMLMMVSPNSEFSWPVK